MDVHENLNGRTEASMTNLRHCRSSLVVLASVFLATLITVACNQANNGTKETPVATQQAIPTTRQIYVIFEGPWAFAPDPKDANIVIALAPKTKSHKDLIVQSSDKTLASGIYDLSLPARTGPATGTVDPNILQAKIDPQSVQHVLDNKLERYAIRLPKPEAYVAATRYRSRAGSVYPPDASTEKDYVTSVSLRYSVSTLTGFSLAGAPDIGSFNPLLLQVETPTVNFVIEPAHDPDPADKCTTHPREAFRDLTKLLNLNLFVDFPNDPSECHDKDPQNPRSVKTEVTPSFPSSLIRGSAGGLQQQLAAIYFLGIHGGTCKAPIIVAGG
jgi:hypothetical protein